MSTRRAPMRVFRSRVLRRWPMSDAERIHPWVAQCRLCAWLPEGYPSRMAALLAASKHLADHRNPPFRADDK